MAFELPALPNFNVQVPDLTQKALEGAQLRNMMSEMALRQAIAPSQIQQAQQAAQSADIENQMKRIQLQDSQAFSNYIKNGTATEAPGDFSMREKIAAFSGMDKDDPYMSVLSGLAQAGMSGMGLMAQAQTAIQRRKEYNQGTVEAQKIIKDNYDAWKDALGPIFNAKPEEQGPLVAAALPRLMQATHLSPELASMVNLLQKDAQAAVPIAYNMVAAQEKALGLQKAKAEAGETQAKELSAQIAATEAAAEATGAVTPKMATEQTQKLALTKAEAQAREQVQASMLPLMEQIRQQFGNQKDARDKIDTQVLKPYQEKMTDITMARNAIAQAADNPVAARAAVFKMVGVAQPSGSHRVLPMEFQAFKYPGGITDQVRERFNNFLTGEPWTPEIAQAANAFIDSQDAAAKARLNGGIDEQNALFGTTVGAGLKQTATPQPTAPTAITYQPGLIRNGYKFKGGDPTKKENWEKQ